MNPYNKEFYKNQNQKISILKDYAESLYAILSPSTIIDVGCGPGHALSQFKKHNCEVLGLEYSAIHAKEFADSSIVDFIENCDVTTWLNDWKFKKYDLAMSWHMAEHVDEKYAKSIVKGMTMLSDTIHWSAAPVGQRGVNHINCKNPDWWERLFNEEGYNIDKETTDKWYIPLKEKYGDNRQGKGIRDNAMIFVR